LENSYHKFNLGVTSCSAESTHTCHVFSCFDGTHPRSWRHYAMTPEIEWI